jgi:hypothetical protein
MFRQPAIEEQRRTATSIRVNLRRLVIGPVWKTG